MSTIGRSASAACLTFAVLLVNPASASGQDPSLPLPLREFTVRTLYSPADEGATGGGSYPRIIRLEHHAPARGDLLVTFGAGRSLPIYRSGDNGESWELLSRVEGISGQPTLYELPHAMGDLPAGTVLASGMAAQPDRDKTVLDVYASTDGGRTWTFRSTLIEGGRGIYDPAQRAGDTKETPVWEPFLLADAQGRLVAYYSAELHKDRYNQYLAHKVSTDGGRTWGEEEFDVAIPDQLTRPGMSIVTRMGDGRYILSYELVSKEGYPLEPRSNPVHFKISQDGVDFGDPADYGTLIQDRRRQFLTGTPYIVWSPWPAPRGTLIASARGTMRENTGLVGNGVMINQNGGEGYWTLVETPISYIPGPSGYSPTLIPVGDGREIMQLVPVDRTIRYATFPLPRLDAPAE